MWANIVAGTLGIVFTGTVVTMGIVYGDEIGKSSVFTSIVNGLQNISVVSDLEVSIDKEPANDLTDNEKNYTPYSVSGTSDKDIAFGVKYGKLLIGVTDSENWWSTNIESRKALVYDAKSVIFKDIKSAENAAVTAKSKCKEAYEKKESDLGSEDIDNIWILCSSIKSRPLPVLTSRSKYQGKLAAEEKYAPYFLEDRPKNKYAWEMLYEKFVKSADDDSKSEEFKVVNRGYSKEEGTSLNKVCFNAYSNEAAKLEASGKEQYKQNVLKFCSFTNADLQVSK